MKVFYTAGKLVCMVTFCALWLSTGSKILANGKAAIPPGNPRYLSLSIMNVESDDSYLPVMERAAAAGVNSFLLNVNWERIHSKRGDQPNWDQIDKQAALAVKLGCKIMLRIWVARHDDGDGGWWPDASRPVSGDGLRRGLLGGFSYSDNNAIEEANGFVREVLEHFRPRQQAGQIALVSVIITSAAEIGYNIDAFNPSIQQNSLQSFDYTYLTRTAFQKWVENKYKTTTNLNQSWNSDYSRFTDIWPPYVANDVWSAYYGKIGQDWYMFRHEVLRGMIDKFIATTKQVDPSYRYYHDMGSCYDPLSVLRGTLGFKNLCKDVDGLKVNDGPSYPHRFAMDLLRSNLPGKIVGNELEYFEGSWAPESWRNHINESFEHGADWVNLFGFDRDFRYPHIENIVREAAAKWLHSPVPTIHTTQTVTYTLSEAIRQGTGNVQGKWQTEYALTKKPIKVVLQEDLIGESTVENKLPVVVSPLLNQQLSVNEWFQYEIPKTTFTDSDGFITGVTATGLPAGMNLVGWSVEGKVFTSGEYTVTLTATDNAGAKVSTQFKLVITAPALGNIISLFKAGNFLTRRFLRYIQDGDTLRGEDIRQTINILTSPRTGAVGSYAFSMSGPYTISSEDSKAPYGLFGDNGGVTLSEGNYTLTVKSYEGLNLQGPLLSQQTIRFVVVEDSKPSNQPPVLVKAPKDLFAKTGQPFSIRLSDSTFVDPDGHITSFSITGLPDGLKGDGSLISGTPTKKGVYSVKVRVTDNANGASEIGFGFTVSADNLPPVIGGAIPDLTAEVNKPYSYTLSETLFSDPDGQIASITIFGAPEGMSGNGRLLSGVPTKAGAYQLVAIATDNANASAQLTFKLTVLAVNKAPLVINPISDQSVDSNAVFSFTIPENTFLDTDGQISRIEVAGLPTGLSAKDGKISGTPIRVGVFTVVLKAYDDKNAAIETSFKLTVKKVNAPPTADLVPDMLAIMGQVFYFDVRDYFKDNDGTISSITYGSALPPGITANGSQLGGNPTAAGSYPIKVAAKDDKGASTEISFTIRVEKPELRLIIYEAGKEPRKRIREIANADIIARSTLPNLMNLVVESNASITTVTFEVTGPISRNSSDNAAPYGLFGDEEGFKPEVGTYQLKITGYRNNTLVASRSIKFDIIKAGNNPVRQGVEEFDPFVEYEVGKPFPNPFVDRVQVKLEAEASELATVELFSSEGRLLPLNKSNWRVDRTLLEVDMSGIANQPGIYLLRTISAAGEKRTYRLVRDLGN